MSDLQYGAPGSNPYGTPPPNDMGAPGRANGFAITALVCGIVGIFIAEVILGIIAIVFGFLGLRRAAVSGRGRGMAIAGIVLGIIDVVIFVIVIAASSSHGFRIVG